MPTYEYVCEKCGFEFERFQSITAEALRKCPGCGKAGLRRLIGSGAGIIFRGSGFYQTDYRSEGYKQAERKEKESSDTGARDNKAGAESKESKSEQAKASVKDKKKSA